MSGARRDGAPARVAAQARAIEVELGWLEAVMSARFAAYGAEPGARAAPPALPKPPPLAGARGPFAALVRELALEPEDRLVLILALAPYVAPALLDPFLLQNQATGRRFTEFGGLTGQSHAGFLPTAETAMFLLAGDDRDARIRNAHRFERDHVLIRGGILLVDQRHGDEPPLASALRLTPGGIHALLLGDAYEPQPGPDFPAARIETPLDWEDLVLDRQTRDQIEMISRWLEHGRRLMDEWGLKRRLKPGYRCLFHGPPGTGKTLTASLLGKRHGIPVYRIDISRVVSKWIGETEKNLAALFDQAENRNWILFFDEADSLFGKRTESHSANDRAANQQIAYLLQRLEDFGGVAILATNQTNHLDKAFARRFQASIRFPMPDKAARILLWRGCFEQGGFALAKDIDLKAVAERYELAGGAIINVLRFACLAAVERDPPVVAAADIHEGVRLELQKEGHYVSR